MITHLLRPGHFVTKRLYSSISSLELQNLDAWIVASEKTLPLSDTLTPTHLADLYVTLPTRDGTLGKKSHKPIEGRKLEYGHHLAFFHPRNPEAVLRPDGTDADFCPPEPFTRRMWAGGSMRWLDPLIIGQTVDAVSTVSSVEKKGFKKGLPMVFVNQTINYMSKGRVNPNVVEGRVHVYLPPGLSRREPREVKGIRSSSDFSFRYTPTATTLFRFSALTFNGHYIHLDKDYAQRKEGYSERLVHGPLTALMLLETTKFHHCSTEFEFFEYRARNPVIVNRPITIHGAWVAENSIELWTLDDEGIVGMTGNITTKQRGDT